MFVTVNRVNQEEFFASVTALQSIFEYGAAAASVFLENITSWVSGPPGSLRDGTEHAKVQLPRDLAAHDNVQTEWWYYTGHGKTETGDVFGFELVFFKRRTDLDSFSIVPLRLIGNPFYFAHFAISDHQTRTFRYAHRKSANGLLDLPAAASSERFFLRLGDWTARNWKNSHILRAGLDDQTLFEASLTPLKAAVLNGCEGLSYKDAGEASRYFSYTRMGMEGYVTRNGRRSSFTGSAWMDREFGTWTPTENQKGWDWFSIQLENNVELMCYQLRNGAGEASPYSSGSFVSENGDYETLASDEFEIVVKDRWQSPNTGADYPSAWIIKAPKRRLELAITPVIADQELDTRGTTMIVYWEGSCDAAGTIAGRPVAGRAYVELVGYDRSHEQPNPATFLTGGAFELPPFAFAPK